MFDKLYKGDDFFYDHPVLTFSVVIFLISIGIILLVVVIHNCSLKEIEFHKDMYVQETAEKAKICQETGYCDSKNINIDYDNKEVENE